MEWHKEETYRGMARTNNQGDIQLMGVDIYEWSASPNVKEGYVVPRPHASSSKHKTLLDVRQCCPFINVDAHEMKVPSVFV